MVGKAGYEELVELLLVDETIRLQVRGGESKKEKSQQQ
jgi:hypothetical protein